MWIVLAFLSALFAGLTSILAKCGIRKTDSTVATAIRTVVVLIMAFCMTLIVGSTGQITSISPKSWIFLVLSGLATGGSWLCYFKALQLGDVNKVVPIDKSSTVLTIIFAAVFLREPVSWLGWLCVVGIAVGTYLMIEKKARTGGAKSRAWLIYAALSAVFAALTSILGKVGIENVESNLGTTVRTAVVLLAAWGMVLVTKKGSQLKTIPKKELGFICLSGLATGGSWLCYYKALKDGLASVVVPIDKLSILVTVAFSYMLSLLLFAGKVHCLVKFPREIFHFAREFFKICLTTDKILIFRALYQFVLSRASCHNEYDCEANCRYAAERKRQKVHEFRIRKPGFSEQGFAFGKFIYKSLFEIFKFRFRFEFVVCQNICKSEKINKPRAEKHSDYHNYNHSLMRMRFFCRVFSVFAVRDIVFCELLCQERIFRFFFQFLFLLVFGYGQISRVEKPCQVSVLVIFAVFKYPAESFHSFSFDLNGFGICRGLKQYFFFFHFLSLLN